MEDDGYSIPFSSLIAGLFLFKQNIKPLEIMKVISDLELDNIYVDDSEDDMDFLSFCIDFNKDCSFSLKSSFCYQTLLDNGNFLYQFLEDTAGDIIISFFKKHAKYMNDFNLVYNKNHFVSSIGVFQRERHKVLSKKKKVLFFIPSFVKEFH